MMKQVKVLGLLLVLSICLVEAKQGINGLHRLLESKRLQHQWHVKEDLDIAKPEYYSPVYVGAQDGLKKADKIDALPGQPYKGDQGFGQYAGYVTVDPVDGKALFYYFVESPFNSSTNPLLLWLTGGPGCSSLGIGALQEFGPFRVNSDNKTLFQNKYAWNSVANVIFLDSPAGVGFSFSNATRDDNASDTGTVDDAYTFLVNWLERFPEYKNRELFMGGENYASYFTAQLSRRILLHNKNSTNRNAINLKGIAVGNGVIKDPTDDSFGELYYFWSHALISDESYEGTLKYCNFSNATISKMCEHFIVRALTEMGDIDIANIYAPICHENSEHNNGSLQSVDVYDPCSDNYVKAYLNNIEVQKALHVNRNTAWKECSRFNWTIASSILPEIEYLMQNGVNIWMYSGDADGAIPVTNSRYMINNLKLPIRKTWHPWYSGNEVGGYVVEYEGLTFVTVRGAGHYVPSSQPKRALTMISSFLKGNVPPSSP